MHASVRSTIVESVRATEDRLNAQSEQRIDGAIAKAANR